MKRIALAIFLLVASAHCVRADTVTIRPGVTLEKVGPVTLEMIATLEGPRALALADVIVAKTPDTLPSAGSPLTRKLDLRTIRDAISNEPGVNWAFISIRGRGITLTLPGARPLDLGPEDVAGLAKPLRTGLTDLPAGSVGAFARGVVRSILRVPDKDLRIVWPARHAEFLTSLVGTQTLHVQPIGASDRMPLSFTVYDGDRIVRTERVRAEIRVRRDVLVVSRPLRRGIEIGPADFTSRSSWIGPGFDPASDVVGQVTSRRLEPGLIIQIGDVTPPLVIERGELIILHCIAGAVAIKSPARALSDARDGETISVEMESTGRRVIARASGPGTAVLIVHPTPPPAKPARRAPPQQGKTQ